jgi:hypothetical protein
MEVAILTAITQRHLWGLHDILRGETMKLSFSVKAEVV